MDEYERFCAQAHPRLVAAFAHHFGDRYLAEDLAQEALIRAREHWARVRGLDAPIGWAYRVGCNLGTSAVRRRANERRAVARRGELGALAVHVDPDTSERDAVRAALSRLPERQRQAVIARHYLGLSAAEAAEALGTTPGALRVLAHRGLVALRAELEGMEAVDA